MPEGFHPPLEEYLEAVLALEEEGVPVIQARLVERLGHSAQSVSEMVHRLVGEGHLRRSGRGLELSEKGRLRAESVVRRHRLAERFLVDVLGLDWHLAHTEAGRWEHVISDEVERRLDAILGHPTTCPHGNPIPGSRPGADLASQRPMSDSAPGETIRLERIPEQVETDAEVLALLHGLGLRPGRQATVQARGDDGSLTLVLHAEEAAGGRVVELSGQICRRLYVVAV